MRSASVDQGRGATLRWPVLTFLALLLITKLIGTPQPSVQALFVVGCFVVPVWWASGRGRPWLLSLRWWLLGAQAVLTYVPFAVLGNGWLGGMTGLLAALVLLVVTSPWRWVLVLGLVAIELTLWLGVVGVPYLPAANAGPWVVVSLTDIALALFGLCALADISDDLHRTRTEIAERSVARVRLDAAAQLRATVDERIDVIAAQTRAALRCLASPAGDDVTAGRAEITAAAANGRAVVAAARTVGNLDPDDGVTTSVHDRSADRTVLAPRLARGVLAGLLTGFAVQAVVNAAFPFGDDAWIDRRGLAIVVAVAASLGVAYLQWRHSTTRSGTRSRGWPLTLAVMAVLAVAPFPFVGAEGLILTTFVSASVLLLVPGRVGWFWFAVSQLATLALTLSAPGELDRATVLIVISYTAGALTVSIMVFGLSRSSLAAVELDDARHELAALAVVRERLRLAQDTHDLLGLGLSTLALKADLAAALLEHDPSRARRELADILRVCAAVRADAAGITADTITLTLASELAVAGDILTASGVDAQWPASVPHLPAEVDALLARVVREAVTNALRHGGGRRVVVQLTSTDHGLVLRVANDTRGSSGRQGGSGLANLDHRLAEHGGRLAIVSDGDEFVLTVELPPVTVDAPVVAPASV